MTATRHHVSSSLRAALDVRCPRCFGKGLEGQDERPGLLIDSARGTDECRLCGGSGTRAWTEDDFDKREYLEHACYILDQAEALAALDPDFRSDLERLVGRV